MSKPRKLAEPKLWHAKSIAQWNDFGKRCERDKKWQLTIIKKHEKLPHKQKGKN